MIDLYLVFFLVGGLVFAGIVWYSTSLQRGRNQTPKEDYVDPLFAELEDTKAREKDSSLDAAKPVEKNDAQSGEPPVNAAKVNGGETQKQAPQLSEKPPLEVKPDGEGGGRESLPVIEETAPRKFAETAKQGSSKIEPQISIPQKVVPAVDEVKTSSSERADANDVSDSAPSSDKSRLNKAETDELSVDDVLKSRAAGSEVRPKTKSFTQKLAEKVAQRTGSRQAKEGVANRSVKDKAVTLEPTLQSKQASSTSTPSGAGSETIDKPKVDRQSSSILTELVARVKNPEPIEQQNLLSLFRAHDFKFHRKVHIYGLNQLTDLWRDIEFEMPSARFVELGVSIQLADRDGAMTDKELHDFQQMTLEFSNNFDAPFEFSMDIDEALKQAQLLDQIGRRYDSMAVLNVVPKTKSGFRMADIESCARDLMMSTDKNGIFMKTEGQKHNVSVLYRLACTDGSGHFGLSSSALGPVHDLVVYMNVPATSDPEAVFQQMVKDANSLATWLEGKVVDRAGRAMTQRSYSTLMQQISDIAFSMQQDGLIPGDEISKKLF